MKDDQNTFPLSDVVGSRYSDCFTAGKWISSTGFGNTFAGADQVFSVKVPEEEFSQAAEFLSSHGYEKALIKD